MKIKSDHLLVRELTLTDAESFFSIYSEAQAMKFRQTPPTLSIAEARQTIENVQRDRINGTAFRLAVIEASSQELIGTFIYIPKDSETVEIGYSLGKNHWNKGYASELVALMITDLQAKGYHHIEARTAKENLASQRVLIKNNFVLSTKKRVDKKLLFQHAPVDNLKSNISILGCGWLGFPLAQHLIKLGCQVKGSTTTAAKLAVLENQEITPYHINLSDPVVDTTSIDAFLDHCDILIIAIPPRFNSATTPYHEQLEQLLPFLCNSVVKRVIFISSTSVYGSQSALITEKTPTNPETASGGQIVAAENLFRSEGLWKTTVLRLGGLFGPLRHPVTFLTKKSEFENPDLSVNMVHLNDVISFTSQLIFQNQQEADAVFNLVAPYHQTRKEFYQQAANNHRLELPPESTTNWALQKKVSGDAIVEKTGIDYLF